MKFLVVRTQGIRPGNQIHSSLFPIVVNSHSHTTSEDIVRKACATINESYIGMHEYLVVPLDNAMVVSFKPRQNYDVNVRSYE